MAVIVDLQGRKVLEANLKGEDDVISTANISKGVYIIQVKTNVKTVSLEFIKQ